MMVGKGPLSSEKEKERETVNKPYSGPCKKNALEFFVSSRKRILIKIRGRRNKKKVSKYYQYIYKKGNYHENLPALFLLTTVQRTQALCETRPLP